MSKHHKLTNQSNTSDVFRENVSGGNLASGSLGEERVQNLMRCQRPQSRSAATGAPSAALVDVTDDVRQHASY